MVGAFLSTLFPPTGPAVAQLPALSQTLRLLVCALLVSVPDATFVESEKLLSPALASDELPSEAVQPILTSAACHCPSDAPQVTAGAVLSSLMVSVCGALRLPALSFAW